MINSFFAKAAPSMADAGLDIGTVLWGRVPPQSGIDHGDGTVRILCSTVSDPLARMQFEYRAAVNPRLFSANAREITARRMSASDVVPGYVSPTASDFTRPVHAVSDTALAGASWSDLPVAVPSMFNTIHGSWHA